jgi:serine/threonine-protein kinase RsbT
LTRTVVEIRTPEQVNAARKVVQDRAVNLGFGTLERTKFVTAASELARNALVHGGGGTMALVELKANGRIGLQLEFKDRGPGIADVSLALKDGYTTARSLGLGLGGAKRLVNEFEITSSPADGTLVRIVQWKRR